MGERACTSLLILPTAIALSYLIIKYLPRFARPIIFQGLTQAEEMLIAAVLPIMTLYHLPQGQYGYNGHVVNLPQDIASSAKSLPRPPQDLDVIIVYKEGSS